MSEAKAKDSATLAQRLAAVRDALDPLDSEIEQIEGYIRLLRGVIEKHTGSQFPDALPLANDVGCLVTALDRSAEEMNAHFKKAWGIAGGRHLEEYA